MEANKVSREKHPSPFDVSLKVADSELRAHRKVLSDGSEYFRSLLGGSFKEASDSEIDLTRVTSNFTVLIEVMDFMYTKEIDINDENISDIVKLASYFCMEKLQKVCEQFMLKTVNKDSCLNYFVLGVDHGLKNLQKVCEQLMLDTVNKDTCLNFFVLGVDHGLKNLQKFCEQFMLDTVNKDNCLNYYIFGVDHGLKTVEEKSGIVLHSRLHDYLITGDTMLTLLPSELNLISSEGFFKNCSLPSIVCFLSKWVKQGESDQHVSVASELLENYVAATDSKVKFNIDLKPRCKSASETLKDCHLKPELCRKVEDSVRQNAGPLPQDLEKVVLTISPRKNVVDKCMKVLRFHEKFAEDILDICLYVPARKQWYYLKSLEDDNEINSEILYSGELNLGRFTVMKHYLFIAIQKRNTPVYVFDLRDFSVRKIPFYHVFVKDLQTCVNFKDTYNHELFSDIWLTVGEDTIYMIINIMGRDEWWSEVTGYRQLVYKLEQDDSWVEVCNTSKNHSNYDNNNVYACVNDGEMLLVCRCIDDARYAVIDLKCPNQNFNPEIELSPEVKMEDADGQQHGCLFDAWCLHFLKKGPNVYVVNEGTREEKETTNLTKYTCNAVLKPKSKTLESSSGTEIAFGEKEKKRIKPCEYQMAFNDGKSIWNFIGDPATDQSRLTEVFVGDNEQLEKREHIPPPFSSIINGAAGKVDLAELKLTPVAEYFY